MNTRPGQWKPTAPGVTGGALAIFVLASLFATDIPLYAASSAVGAYGLPGVIAWYRRQNRRSWAWYWIFAWAGIGTLAGAFLGELLLGFDPATAAAGALGFSIGFGWLPCLSSGLIIYSAMTRRSSSDPMTGVEDDLWIFGYGSLMIDGWQNEFGGSDGSPATLTGFRRSFNKVSTRNWGSREHPCPTLGLERDEAARCVGRVFRFPRSERERVLDYLGGREGRSFELQELWISTKGGQTVRAMVPVNDTGAKSYIGELPIRERAAMIQSASGTSGSCGEYVERISTVLRLMGVNDPHVDEFIEALEAVQVDRSE